MPATRSSTTSMNSRYDPIIQASPKEGRSQKETRPEDEDVGLPPNNSTEPDRKGRPKPRPRGRPRAVPTMPASTEDNNAGLTSPTEIGTRKRAHEAGTAALGLDDDPPPKRTKGATKKKETVPTKEKTSRARKPAVVAVVRDPLPDRPGRNIHPVKLPPTRRTSQEVAAERDAKKRAIEEKIREGERAKDLLAQLNVNEELYDEELYDNPQCLSAALRKRGACLDDSDGEGEKFDFGAAEDGSDSDVLSVASAKGKGKRGKKSKKAVKGSLRKDIQEKETIRRGADDGGRGNEMINRRPAVANKGFTPFDSAPKKYQNAGLRKDLKPNSKKVSETIDPFESGGLVDEDVVSVRPSFPSHANRAPVPRARTTYPEDLQRDHLRKNDLVEVAPDQSDSDSKIKVKNSRTKPQKKENIKREKKAPAAIDSTAAEFVDDARWTNVFLPTISHALYISREPFLDWTSESHTFLHTVQVVFNLAFPNVDLTLGSDDRLVITAYKRMNTRKSKIAGDVLDFIKKFFQSAEFVHRPDKIREYVHWALKPGGSAYYQLPTPQTCKVACDHPGYVAPDGFLQSKFITPFAEQNLRYARNSVLHPSLDAKHPPQGLYTLILTAVERSFTAHVKGSYIEAPIFAYKNYWRPLQQFLGNTDRVSERRWKLILNFKDGDNNTDKDLRADESMISAYCDDLYIPSSPQKP